MEKICARRGRLPYTRLRPCETADEPIAKRPKKSRAVVSIIRPEDSTNIVQWLITQSPIERKI